MDMMQTLSQGSFRCRGGQIDSAARLIDEANTIPFIARYPQGGNWRAGRHGAVGI